MAGIAYRYLDPFIMMDHMGEVDYAAGEPRGTNWHPHRGFETVTYLIDGQFVHQDTHGGGGVITRGLHAVDDRRRRACCTSRRRRRSSSRTAACSTASSSGSTCRPKDKFSAPAYQPVEANDLLLLASEDGGSLLRVIAGEVDGHVGPVRRTRRSRCCTRRSPPGAQLSLPWQPTYNALAYVYAGSGTVGPKAEPIHAGQLAVFGAGDRITIAADAKQDSRTSSLEVILLGGEPISEPMVHYGPFVMNTRDELAQALEDYQAGRLGVIPPDAIMPHVPARADPIALGERLFAHGGQRRLEWRTRTS